MRDVAAAMARIVGLVRVGQYLRHGGQCTHHQLLGQRLFADQQRADRLAQIAARHAPVARSGDGNRCRKKRADTISMRAGELLPSPIVTDVSFRYLNVTVPWRSVNRAAAIAI